RANRDLDETKLPPRHPFPDGSNLRGGAATRSEIRIPKSEKNPDAKDSKFESYRPSKFRQTETTDFEFVRCFGFRHSSFCFTDGLIPLPHWSPGRRHGQHRGRAQSRH